MRALRSILFAAALGGCSVGPDYERPETHLPERFLAQTEDRNQPGTTTSQENLREWWKQFGDPDLDRLIENSITSNIDLKIAEARLREARGEVSLARSGFFPNVDIEGTYSRSKSSENASSFNSGGSDGSGEGSDSSTTGRERSLFDAGFDAIWEVDIFGGTRREVEAARANYESEVEAARGTFVSLLAEVARNYVALRGAQRQLAIAKSNIAIQEETLELQQMKASAGLVNELTVEQALAQLQSTRAALPRIEQRIFQAAQRLALLSNQDASMLLQEIAPHRPIPAGSGEVLPTLPSALLTRRPDVRRAERQIEVASAGIGVAVADLFPRFELTGSLGVRARNFSDLGSSSSAYWSGGPGVTWQILSFPAILSNIETQSARHEQAVWQYKRVVLAAVEETENSLFGLKQENARLGSLRAAVEANSRAYQLATELNTAGLADFLNVLNAQQALFQSEQELVETELLVADRLVAVYKALGGGW